MPDGAITGHIDVAQVTLYVFWVFFIGLIFYLRREDRREGYPLEPDVPTGRARPLGDDIFPWSPAPKVFLLRDGSTRTAPNDRPDTDRPLKVERFAVWPGAALQPSGDPMADAVGPAAYVDRETTPECMMDGAPMIAPLRVARDFAIDERDPDPRGMTVVGCDNVIGGKVTDVWVDRVEPQIRYLEVQPVASGKPAAAADEDADALPAPTAKTVLLPIYYASGINRTRRRIFVESIRGDQFADVPTLSKADEVSKREEDQITAFYAAGHLYAAPGRFGPAL